jgi:hypothetical protein
MGGDTVDEEGSDRERTKQRRASMCFVPPLAKNRDSHHQMMARMEPNKWGEASATHHLEEVVQNAMGLIQWMRKEATGSKQSRGEQ